jgi:hypothetical protein
MSVGFIVVGLALLWYRHGPGRPAEPQDDAEPDAAATDDAGDLEEDTPASATDSPPA